MQFVKLDSYQTEEEAGAARDKLAQHGIPAWLKQGRVVVASDLDSSFDLTIPRDKFPMARQILESSL